VALYSITAAGQRLGERVTFTEAVAFADAQVAAVPGGRTVYVYDEHGDHALPSYIAGGTRLDVVAFLGLDDESMGAAR
jgi:hypothetical protein